MSEADSPSGLRAAKRRSAAHQRYVPVAGLLRDCIVGITCFS